MSDTQNTKQERTDDMTDTQAVLEYLDKARRESDDLMLGCAYHITRLGADVTRLRAENERFRGALVTGLLASSQLSIWADSDKAKALHNDFCQEAHAAPNTDGEG